MAPSEATSNSRATDNSLIRQEGNEIQRPKLELGKFWLETTVFFKKG